MLFLSSASGTPGGTHDNAAPPASGTRQSCPSLLGERLRHPGEAIAAQGCCPLGPRGYQLSPPVVPSAPSVEGGSAVSGNEFPLMPIIKRPAIKGTHALWEQKRAISGVSFFDPKLSTSGATSAKKRSKLHHRGKRKMSPENQKPTLGEVGDPF